MSKLTKRCPIIGLPLAVPSHTSTASERTSISGSSLQEFNFNQDRLPLVRPPSPLQLDISTHQPWHNRRTNFELSPKPEGHHSRASTVSSPSTSRKTSSSIEALASLVWIGAPSMGASVSATCVPAHHPKPNAIPTNQEINVLFSMAVDESLSDEIVVERLEIIRKRSSRMENDVTKTASHNLAGAPLSSKRRCSPTEFRLGEYPVCDTILACQSEIFGPGQQSLPASVILDDPELDPDDAIVWRTVRKALFCIREFLRTERNYQESLRVLLAGQTANPPPSLMLSYLPDLIRVSEALLKADPSAWGVSAAFIACEDDIETAMVSWSSVAGSFFAGGETGSPSIGEKWRRRKSLLLSASSSPVAEKSNRNSAPVSLSDPPPLLCLMNEAGNRVRQRQRTYEYYRKVSGDGGVDFPTERSPRVSSGDKKGSRADDAKGGLPTRRPSVRELAIQPTQRVMRYVLLYQDLLENTPPTSPSHALVERALEAATHIASKCNRAQGNVDFLRR